MNIKLSKIILSQKLLLELRERIKDVDYSDFMIEIRKEKEKLKKIN